MPPLHLLNGLRRLVPSEFESKLLRAGIYDTTAGDWTAKAKNDGVLFDLSRVEWVELGALVQLTLLVESALLRSIRVVVALPIPRLRRSEEKWIERSSVEGASERIGDQIDRRGKVLDFLDYLGFVTALKPKHLGDLKNNLTLLLDYDPRRGDVLEAPPARLEEQPVRSTKEPEKLYQFFFPLTWLSKGNDAETQDIAKFLSSVIGQPERGLEAIDADAISNVILYELIDNVKRHARGSGHALVGAWASHERRVYDKAHYIDCEQGFIEWLSDQQRQSVEIVVGDSGTGVPKVLEAFFDKSADSNGKKLRKTKSKTAQILQWAFDRWSTSRETQELRGTRGLYRVDRVVSKYQGIITLRSENAMAGRDHGGAFDQPIAATQSLSHIPGTILRCRIPSFREDLSPRISVGRVPRALDFEVVKLGAIEAEGFPGEGLTRLKESLRRARPERPLCVVGVVEGSILDIVPNSSVEATLRQCVETRHPGTLVILGLPGGWELIEGAIVSINLEHEEKARGRESANVEHFEIWDAVLIIGPQGQYKWVGANVAERVVLDEMLASDQGLITQEAFRALVPDDQLRASTLRYFRSDTNLIKFSDERSDLELLVTGAEIINFTKRQIDEYLRPGSREGIQTGEIYRTPSLLLVDRWLSAEKIVEKSCGEELLMFALVQLLRQTAAWDSLNPPNTILADSTVSSTHVKKLKQYLGKEIKTRTIPRETGVPILPGARVLPDNARVVVYCDVIAASEAVGRCLRLIRKEGAQAAAVICVVDARINSGNNLTLADMEVPVISVTRLEMIVSDELAPAALNISPITKNTEEQTEQPVKYEISEIDLKELIAKKNVLHLSHIGREIGRHFTFYMNAILDEPLIIDAFNRTIDAALEEWKKKDPTEKYRELELWYPSPESFGSEPARRFADAIKTARKDIKIPQIIRRVPAYGHWVFAGPSTVSCPVIVVDWGALTGSTVMQAIRLAADAGARKVLVCVFLSQLKADEELFLRSLKTVRGLSHTSTTDPHGIPSLLDERTRVPSETEVIVRFLAGFPIEAYNPYECPVCLQLTRLSQESYPTELLRAFAERQEEIRLRLRTRQEVVKAIPQDFDNRPMSVEATLWMMSFRGGLVKALTSTAARLEIRDIIDALLDELQGQVSPPQEALWLLQFLSIESQWLRRPPLYFKQLRDAISEIGLGVALKTNVSEGDRLNAVIVLRTSNKSRFADNFTLLFRAAGSSEQLIQQLLYDAFTYLTRPYHQTPIVFRPIRNGLRDVQKLIRDKSTPLSGSTSRELGQTVDLLLMRAETELAKAGVRLDTPVEAWAKLRTLFSPENYKKHDPIPLAIRWMVPALDAEIIDRQILEAEQHPFVSRQADTTVVPWLKSLKENWETCSTFLDYNVLPLLARLKPVLISKEGRDALGNETIDWLIPLIHELSEFKAPISESEFTRLVNRISEAPDTILTTETWAKYKSQVEWYRQRLLNPQRDSDSSLGVKQANASLLVKFLLSAPVSVWPTVRMVYDGLLPELPQSHTVLGIPSIHETIDHKVFCTERLLKDVVKELLGNIEEHTMNRHSPVNIWIDVKDTMETVTLTISNDNSIRSESPGSGLDNLDDRLQPFQAGLKRNPRPGNIELTYSVDVTFQKGD